MVLFWTGTAFFIVPVIGGIAFGAALGYSITHGMPLALAPEFLIGCSVAALVVGRVGYVLAVLGCLPGAKAKAEH